MANRTIERIPVIQNPVLFDRTIQEVQQGLVAQLPWLSHAFGKAQKITRRGVNGKTYRTPSVYAGGNEYLDVSPNDQYGCFSFFTLDDPQTVEQSRPAPGSLEAEYNLIFWVDLRRISGAENRNVEFVKLSILKALNGKIKITDGRITVSRIYEEAPNVYQGFSLDEIDNQFLTHPFAGFRFKGNLIIANLC